MKVYFIEGCLTEEEEFYLIVDNGKIEERRSIEEVRGLLDNHPELIDAYFNLEKLYKDYWWLILPDMVVS